MLHNHCFSLLAVFPFPHTAWKWKLKLAVPETIKIPGMQHVLPSLFCCMSLSVFISLSQTCIRNETERKPVLDGTMVPAMHVDCM